MPASVLTLRRLRGAALVAAGFGAAGFGAAGLSLRPGAPGEELELRGPAAISGRVVDERGEPVRGAFVTATREGGGPAVTVFSGPRGGFAFPELPPGNRRVEARLGPGLAPRAAAAATHASGSSGALTLRVRRPDPRAVAPSSARLALLPAGEVKRRFILDCTGCHQMSERFALRDGRPRSRDDWEQAIARMLSFAGPESGFPVIAHGREPGATAAWLVEHWGEPPGAGPRLSPPPAPAGAALAAVITTYPMPAGELPHDVRLDPQGRPVVTGMFRGVMYRLEPASGAVEEVALPVEQAGPRALEIEPDGTWWVLLGGPMRLARRDAESGAWTQHDLGAYPHSVALGRDGRLWYNAHFGKDPAWIASVEPATGEIQRHAIPLAGDPPRGTPIPYEVRIGPEGAVWGSELVGNRVFRFDPAAGEFRTWTLPTPHSGPRRLDVGPDGVVWIPEYAANRLARLDPATGEIREYELPTRDALPYVARVDRRTGHVWVAESGADALARFDPETETFLEIPLPVRPGLVRHLDVDPRTGAVWAATAQAPPEVPAILRVELPSRAAAALAAAGPLAAQADAESSSCAADPLRRELDFWLGEWDVRVGGRSVGTNRIEKVLAGCAVLEQWTDAGGGRGTSLFYVPPAARTWKQVWVTDRATAPGGTKEKLRVDAGPPGAVRFQGEVPLPDGSTYLDRTTLAPTADGVRQVIESSRDGGETWRTDFDALYVKRDTDTSVRTP